jgi:cytochrome c oxidase subunit III
MSAKVLDVSALPPRAFGARSALWWGVLGLVAIEGTALAMVVGAALYLRQGGDGWPPPGTPLPRLTAATINVFLLVASSALMWMVALDARRRRRVPVAVGLVLMTVVGLASIVLRGFELAALGCRWDAGAYASTVWLLLGMHATHLIGATVENGLLAAVIIGPVDPKHYVDAHSNGLYWYFVAGADVVLYLLVFVWPRWA